MLLLFLLFTLICLPSFGGVGGGSPIINPDGTVTFTFSVPEADDVLLRGDVQKEAFRMKTPFKTFTKLEEHKLQQVDDTTWSITLPPLAPDMYMYYFEVDGEDDGDSLDARNPWIVRDMDRRYSAFIYPGGSADNYLDNPDIPHGSVIKSWYYSSYVASPRRRMTIYLPPGYDDNLSPSALSSHLSSEFSPLFCDKSQTPSSPSSLSSHLSAESSPLFCDKSQNPASPSPPSEGAAPYPTLYLLHGTGGNATSWLECGRAAQIFDNLIAHGKMQPMIVVMPDCNFDRDVVNPDDNRDDNSNGNVIGQFGRFESCFVHDIVAHVDSMFLTIPDKEHRAIAGLSLGGMQTLYTAVNNPDVFGYVALFSAQTEPYYMSSNIDYMQSTSEIASAFSRGVKKLLPFIGDGMRRRADSYADNLAGLEVYKNLDHKLAVFFAKNPRLFYVACGEDDFVLNMNESLLRKLNKHSYPFVYNESPGGHTWSNWRHYLLDLLPRLFK